MSEERSARTESDHPATLHSPPHLPHPTPKHGGWDSTSFPGDPCLSLPLLLTYSGLDVPRHFWAANLSQLHRMAHHPCLLYAYLDVGICLGVTATSVD